MATINLGAIKFNWKGAFNNSTAYAVDDVVSSGGNSYVCIQASQGNAVGNATAYWNIMSAAGTNGSNGTDLSSTLSTRGDLVFKNASALARLAKGTAGQVLGQGANDPAWVNGSSSTLTTQGDLLYRDGSGLQRLAKGTAAKVLAMNSAANAPEWVTAGGGILQYKHVIKTDTQAINSPNFGMTLISGLSVAITPSSTNNKILVNVGIQSDSADGYRSAGIIFRGSTGIGLGTNTGSRKPATFGIYGKPNGHHSTHQAVLDAPSSTSAITYTVGVGHEGSGSAIIGINRSHADSNDATHARLSSYISVTEISGGIL